MSPFIKVTARWLLQAVPVIMLVLVSSLLLTASSIEEFRTNSLSAKEGEEVTPPTSPVTGLIPEEELSSVVPSGTKTVTYNESGENITAEVPTGKGKAFSGLVNGALLVAIGAVSGLTFYLLLKRGKKRALIIIFSALFLFIISLGCLLDSYLLLEGAGLWRENLFVPLILLSILIALPLTGAIVFSPRFRPAALLAISVILGVFLAYSLPIYVILPLSVGAALWDWRAARKGVIKRIVELEDLLGSTGRRVAKSAHPGRKTPRKLARKKGRGLPDFTEIGLYDAGEWQIGLGDLVIYSALGASIVRHYFVILPAVGITTLAQGLIVALLLALSLSLVCLAGLVRTSLYVQEGDIFPALPFPVGGMALFYAAYTMVLEVFSLIKTGGLFSPI